MSEFSYNISDKLKTILDKIDSKRVQILAVPISPKDELRLRWEAHVDRIHALFSLKDGSITKGNIIKLLSFGKNKKFKDLEQELIDYKRGFDFVRENWLVSKKNLSARAVTNLYAIVNRKSRVPVKEEKLRNLLEFLDKSREHPVVLSGIAAMQYLTLTNRGFFEEKISKLLSYLFLYKYGYDFRGLLKIEELYSKDKGNYSSIFDKSIENGNLTLWLEYYAGKIFEQLEEVEKDAGMVRLHLDIPARNWDLNDRQREILNILDEPNKTITNRKVQQIFKVSQITASRDLAGLEVLGYIFDHGKGRSVYYTRV